MGGNARTGVPYHPFRIHRTWNFKVLTFITTTSTHKIFRAKIEVLNYLTQNSVDSTCNACYCLLSNNRETTDDTYTDASRSKLT